jgi:hypothetical protein
MIITLKSSAARLLKLRPYKETSSCCVPGKRTDGQSLHDGSLFQRRVKGKHTERNFGSSSGRTSLAEFKSI